VITLLAESDELLTDSAADTSRNLIPKLMVMILQHSELSPSVRRLKHWLSWRREAPDGGNNESEMEMDWTAADTNRDVSLC
jgi:hypothetical protein